MNRLTLLAPVNHYTGYGLHTIQIARDIERLSGAYVSVRATSTSEAFGATIPADIRQRLVSGPQPEHWELLLHPPNFLPTPDKLTAYFTMWEATRLPPGGVNLLNRAEVVFTPSQWNASCFSACGVERPIRVVPLGINTGVFHYRPWPEPEPFVFGTAGRMAHGGVRKGINEVIDAFQAAFPCERDVRLKVKCWPDCPVKAVQDARIQITAAYLGEPQLADWFAGIHVFVSAARSEGWGLMQHQAMAVGRPVMSVDFGGVREFFRPELGYALPYELKPAQKGYAGCGHWAQPSFDGLVESFRRAYEHRSEALEKGARSAAAVEGTDWSQANAVLVERLREVGAL